MTKKLPAVSSNDNQSTSEPTLDTTNNEDCHPPSPTPVCTEADLLPSMLKRLGDLEQKVETLQSKPSEMPSEKEELLNAAVCRVDALEAELIATKKVGCYIYIYIYCRKCRHDNAIYTCRIYVQNTKLFPFFLFPLILYVIFRFIKA